MLIHCCCGRKSWPNLGATAASCDTAAKAARRRWAWRLSNKPRRTTSLCVAVLDLLSSGTEKTIFSCWLTDKRTSLSEVPLIDFPRLKSWTVKSFNGVLRVWLLIRSALAQVHVSLILCNCDPKERVICVSHFYTTCHFLRGRRHIPDRRYALLQEVDQRRWFKSIELMEITRTASFILSIDKSTFVSSIYSSCFDFYRAVLLS